MGTRAKQHDEQFGSVQEAVMTRGCATPRTDVYGLGATLYMLLTGIDPPDAILRATSEPGGDPLLPAHLLSPLIPAAVDAVLRHALALRSDERFSTIELFWQELTAAASEQPEELATKVFVTPFLPLPAEAGSGKSEDLLGKQQEYLTASDWDETHPPNWKMKKAPVAVAPTRISSRHGAQERSLLVMSGLVLVITLLIGMGLLVRGSGTSPGAQPRSPVALATATSPPPTYPRLAPDYVGPIFDLVAQEKTALYLTNIHQLAASLQGKFDGLG